MGTHDSDPRVAFALARITAGGRANRGPIEVFRAVDHSTYDDRVRAQCRNATDGRTARSLAQVIAGADTWSASRPLKPRGER